MTNIDTVSDVYAAFGRGDVASIMEVLADDIEWEYGMADAGVPWLRPRTGRAGALEFFQSLSAVEFLKFEPTMLLASGDVVVALIDLAGAVPGATGPRRHPSDFRPRETASPATTGPRVGRVPGHGSDPSCVRPAQQECWTGEQSFRPSPAFPLVDGTFRGAGGNRTPVHQPLNELATTIPGIATDAVTPTGRLSARGGPRAVFPTSQRSFSPSAVFPAVIPHFCCRAVMDWPRAALLLTMTLRSPENQAARAKSLGLAIVFFAPINESEQLGSQTRTALLTSKPVSPVIDM